ncbi:hypothetical protein U472_08870 [Orenia metallireducens]|uniref:Uncharacterized protein n=1 Tax=Orenia metallireducens TaxID=1413210 RepID=A0A1C0A7C7_9FIRM|nr:hypothetical protein U472_08870 [Orenia metallireducens]
MEKSSSGKKTTLRGILILEGPLRAVYFCTQGYHSERNITSFKVHYHKSKQTYEFYLRGYKATPSWQGQPRTKTLRGFTENKMIFPFVQKQLKQPSLEKI